MKGCRPLDHDEEKHILESLRGPYAFRNRAIFVLGVKLGLRISEILSLKLGDVVQSGRIVDRVYVERCHVKRKLEGRSIVLHKEAKQALDKWIWQLRQDGYMTEDSYLFQSRKGRNRPIGRVQCYKILTQAFRANN